MLVVSHSLLITCMMRHGPTSTFPGSEMRNYNIGMLISLTLAANKYNKFLSSFPKGYHLYVPCFIG